MVVHLPCPHSKVVSMHAADAELSLEPGNGHFPRLLLILEFTLKSTMFEVDRAKLTLNEVGREAPHLAQGQFGPVDLGNHRLKCKFYFR